MSMKRAIEVSVRPQAVPGHDEGPRTSVRGPSPESAEDAVTPGTNECCHDEQDDADQDVAADKTQNSVDRDDDCDDPQDERHGWFSLSSVVTVATARTSTPKS